MSIGPRRAWITEHIRNERLAKSGAERMKALRERRAGYWEEIDDLLGSIIRNEKDAKILADLMAIQELLRRVR